MEGLGVWQPTPAGYLNSTTAFFYPRPEITGENLTLQQVYVSPQGNDDPSNNGVITSPFATISAALFYVTTVSVVFPTPLSEPICIFVAPGTYEGGFAVPDNVYLIGPSNSPLPVIITGNIFISPTSSSSTIGLQNLTLESVTVAGAFYDANLEMRNCKLETNSIFAALTLAPEDELVNVTVTATECVFECTDTTNEALISGNTSELNNLILDNCQLITASEGGSLIDMTGSLAVKNSSLLNTAVGTTLGSLIIINSGVTLTPIVSLEGSVLKYDDLQTDAAGNKLAIRFNAATQPITARMTNCTISIHLGAGETDIVKNIGADTVTLSQSANSCLLDGKTVDETNINLPVAAFLQDSPSGGGGGGAVYQATYYKTTAQNMTSGNTDVTFDGEATWNNDNGYITHTGGTTAFTVVQAGLYQLEFNATILINGATWSTTANKTINIDITRSPTAEQTIVSSTGTQGVQSYSQSICSTFYLDAGDVINLRLGNIFTLGPAQIQQLQNTFDFNTFFTWTYVSASGGGGGVSSVSAGTGIGVTGSGAVTIENNGVLSITDGLAASVGIITMSGGTGVEVLNGPPSGTFTFNNTGVVSLELLTGSVGLVAGSGITIVTDPPPGANNITIGNTGVLSIVPGANITASGTSTATIGYVATPPSVQAAGTTALLPASVNTIFILTSGATQNFTTAGLGVGDGGKVWYVKNGSGSDIDIQENGVAIAGQTDTIHAGTGSANSSIQVLYWTGAALTMY
jgi:hypothetical protein